MRILSRFRPSLSWHALWLTMGLLMRRAERKEGENQSRFEATFADYLGVKEAVSVGSGRVGLYVILKALNVPEGSGVILSGFNYWAIPAVVRALNLKPQFVDVETTTANINPNLIEEQITVDTKVIVVTHLYGRPCDMQAIMRIAQKHNLFVIEDCVQAVGAECEGQKVGTFGDAAYFSFGITKNLSLLGGGMVATNNHALAKTVKERVSEYGVLSKCDVMKRCVVAAVMKICTSPVVFSLLVFPGVYLFSLFGKDIVGSLFVGKKAQLPESLSTLGKTVPVSVQDLIGVCALGGLDALNRKRFENAQNLLRSLKEEKRIVLPPLAPGNVFTSFPIRTDKRQVVSRALFKRGIDSSPGFMQGCSTACPQAQTLEKEILHIPIYPSLSERDVQYLRQVLSRVAEGGVQ